MKHLSTSHEKDKIWNEFDQVNALSPIQLNISELKIKWFDRRKKNDFKVSKANSSSDISTDNILY